MTANGRSELPTGGLFIPPMSLDPAWLFLSLIVSGVGFVLFAYGKKSERWQHMAGGLALMVYPYFVTTIPALVGVGAAIGIAIWYFTRS